jgi:dipeptidase D
MAELLSPAIDDDISLQLLEMSDDNIQTVQGEERFTKNAICREAQTVLAVKPQDTPKLLQMLNRQVAKLKENNKTNDPDLEIIITQPDDYDGKDELLLTRESTRQIIKLLGSLPHGVIDAVANHPDMVLTSTNLAVAKINQFALDFTISMMTRAAKVSDMEEVRQKIADLVKGALNIDQSEVLKGWSAKENSPLIELLSQVWQQLYQKTMTQRVCHAGLEAGTFSADHPTMDIASFGPTIKDPHGTTEKMNLPSDYRFVNFLFAVAQEYAKLYALTL